jgi:capsular exopolysaccharide synthesis family protein
MFCPTSAEGTKTAESALQENSTKPLGVKDAPLFTAYGEGSPFAEAYRTLRVHLFHPSERPLRSLGFTGASPRHGGSTTAANFALIMGETEARVVLVDCDLHRPSLHRFFELPNAVGLSSVLAGEVRATDVLQTITPPSYLKLLAGGPAVQNPAMLLKPRRIKAVLDELGQVADLVIVDLPSVSAIAYTSQIASLLDGVVLVLRAGTEPSDAERLVHRRLKGTNLLGIVLNRVPLRGSDASSYLDYADLK